MTLQGILPLGKATPRRRPELLTLAHVPKLKAHPQPRSAGCLRLVAAGSFGQSNALVKPGLIGQILERTPQGANSTVR